MSYAAAQGMVEFALVLPLLLLLSFGIIELGRMFVIYASVTAASREGARYGSAAGKNASNQYYYMDCQGIRDAIKRVSLLVNVEDANIVIGYDHGPGSSWSPSEQPCPVGSSDDVKLGDRMLVTVGANYAPLLGITSLRPFPIQSISRRTILKGVSIKGNPGAAPNDPPVVIITAPNDGAIFPLNASIDFTGSATDTEDGDLTASLVWNSSLDGSIGTGGSFSRNDLSEGVHTITATVIDSEGLMGTDSITITIINNNSPVVTIDTPSDGSTFEQDQTINFSGTAIDLEDGDISANLVWKDDTTTIGNGAGFSASLSTVGDHTITASVMDSMGFTGSDSILIHVVAKTPPVVTITSPENEALFMLEDMITFSGTATDSKDGNLSASLVWKDGETVIGNGSSFNIDTLAAGWHTITASVTDSDGLTGSASIEIGIMIPLPPEVTITSPEDQSEYNDWETVSFSGTASDYEDGDLTAYLEWYSSIDGHIATGGSFSTSSLSPGTHTIRAEVIDSDDNRVWDSITITILPNTPPVVTIIKPTADAQFQIGQAVGFEGTVYDEQDPDLLPSLTWYSSLATGAIGTGGVFTRTDLIVGTHLITATVTDTGGLTGYATRSIEILPNPCNNINHDTSITLIENSANYFVVGWKFTNISADSYTLKDSYINWSERREKSDLTNAYFYPSTTGYTANMLWEGYDMTGGITSFGPLPYPAYSFQWIMTASRTFPGSGQIEYLIFKFFKEATSADTKVSEISSTFLHTFQGVTTECTYIVYGPQ